MKSISEYEVISHGVFQWKDSPGCELGDWGTVVTQTGMTEQLALEHAYNSLQDIGWSVEDNEPMLAEYVQAGSVAAPEGSAYFVSVRVK